MGTIRILNCPIRCSRSGTKIHQVRRRNQVHTVSQVQKYELARLMYLSQSRGLHYAVSLIFKTMQYWSKLFGQLVTPKEI